jgi:hypothetical protein
MSGSTENTAHGAPDRPGAGEVTLSLTTVRAMLPLVQRVIADITHYQRELDRLLPEQDRLDRQRRDLTWPERARRYQVREEAKAADRSLQDAHDELAHLGVVLLDVDEGRVGFPTVVNNRRAFFSWRRGEEGVNHWHFTDEMTRRPIPAAWAKEHNQAVSAKA